MKEVKRSDLVVGEVYADSKEKKDGLVVLRLIRKTDETLFFGVLSPNCKYVIGSDGTVKFWNDDSHSPFYFDDGLDGKAETPILTLDGIEYSETTLRSLLKKAMQS